MEERGRGGEGEDVRKEGRGEDEGMKGGRMGKVGKIWRREGEEMGSGDGGEREER